MLRRIIKLLLNGLEELLMVSESRIALLFSGYRAHFVATLPIFSRKHSNGNTMPELLL